MISALDYYDTSGKVFQLVRSVDAYLTAMKNKKPTIVPDYDNLVDFVGQKIDEYSQVRLYEGHVNALATEDFHITVADEPLEAEHELISILL